MPTKAQVNNAWKARRRQALREQKGSNEVQSRDHEAVMQEEWKAIKSSLLQDKLATINTTSIEVAELTLKESLKDR